MTYFGARVLLGFRPNREWSVEDSHCPNYDFRDWSGSSTMYTRSVES